MSGKPRFVVQCIGWGLLLGLLADLFALFLFPAFFSSAVELLLAPFLLAFAALLLGALLSLRVKGGDGALPRKLFVTMAVFAVLAVVFYAARAPVRSWTASPKVLLVGIDGATWDVMQPLLDAGELPAFQSLMEDGTSGVLLSIEPTLSPLIWTTIASGVSPHTHGITSFYSTQANIRSKRIWEVLSESSRTVGVFRWWASWPPRSVRGFLIPGIMARDAQTLPIEYGFVNQLRIDFKGGEGMKLGKFAQTLFRFLRHGLRLKTGFQVVAEQGEAYLSGDYIWKHVAKRRTELRINADVYAHLLREFDVDYTSFYDNGVDGVSHHYWHYFEPEKFPDVAPEDAEEYGGIILEHYREVDRFLSGLLPHVDPSTTVLVMSDHGLKASDELAHGRLRPRVKAILEGLGLADEYYGITLGGRSYVESSKVERAELEAAIARAVEILTGITVVETGEPMFELEIENDDRILLFVREETKKEEHLLVDGKEIAVAEWIEERPGKSGTHKLEGILVARGPGIRRGFRIEDATVLDVAPSLYYLMDTPVARDLEGQVLLDLFTDKHRERHAVEWIDTYGVVEPEANEIEVDEATRKKLQALGYVD